MSIAFRLSLAALYALVGLLVLGIIRLSTAFHWLALADVASVQYGLVILLFVGAGVALWKRIPSALFWEGVFHVLLFPAFWYAALLSLPRAAALLVASLCTLLYAFAPRVFFHAFFLMVGVAAMALHLAAWIPIDALLLLGGALVVHGLVVPHAEKSIEKVATLLAPYGLVPGFMIPAEKTSWMLPVVLVSQSHPFRIGLLDVLLPSALVAYVVFVFGYTFGLGIICLVAVAVLFGVSSKAMRRSPAIISLVVSMGCVLLLRAFVV